MNERYLPPDFSRLIQPYVRRKNRRVITEPSELIALWKAALVARAKHPEAQEVIAEWTMSAGSGSPLTNDNDLFDAIHSTFGSLEVPAEDGNEAEWTEVARLIEQAEREMNTKTRL